MNTQIYRALWALVVVLGVFDGALVLLKNERVSAWIVVHLATKAHMQVDGVQGDLLHGLNIAHAQYAKNGTLVQIDGLGVWADARILLGSAHFRQLHATSVTVHTKSSGKAFDYPAIATPIAIIAPNTRLGRLAVNGTHFDNVFGDITWQNADIRVQNGGFDIHGLHIKGDGKISFVAHYPVQAHATIRALDGSISGNYFAIHAIDAHAVGDLDTVNVQAHAKSPHAKMLSAHAALHPLQQGVPVVVQAKADTLGMKDVQGKDATLGAQGTLSPLSLKLAVHSVLHGKYVPKGEYQGCGVLDKSKLDIKSLYFWQNMHKDAIRQPQAMTNTAIFANLAKEVNTPTNIHANATGANLTKNPLAHDNPACDAPSAWRATQGMQADAQGIIDWSHGVNIHIDGNAYALPTHKLLDGLKKQEGYLPKLLHGTLHYKYPSKPHATHSATLSQHDGETWHIQGAQSAWNGSVANVRRSLPSVGFIDLPKGEFSINKNGNSEIIGVRAHIDKLKALPKGDYALSLVRQGDTHTIRSGEYHAPDGGSLMLHGAFNTKARTWQGDFVAKRLTYANFGTLQGRAQAQGSWSDTRHTLTLKQIDAHWQKDSHSVGVRGKGDGFVALHDGKIADGALHFTGDIQPKTPKVPNAPTQAIQVALRGNQDIVYIDTISLQSSAGRANVRGSVAIGKRAWNITGKFDEFMLAPFFAKTDAIITGDFASTGRHHDGKFIDTHADFVGYVRGKRMPNQKVQLHAKTVQNALHIDANVGTSLQMHAIGNKGEWQVRGHTNEFNLHDLHQDFATLTGAFFAEFKHGKWQIIADEIKAKWRNHSVRVHGNLRNVAWRWQKNAPILQNLERVWADIVASDSHATIDIDGDSMAVHSTGKQANVQVDIHDIGRYQKNAWGSVVGRVSGDGKTALFDIVQENIKINKWSAKAVRALGKWQDGTLQARVSAKAVRGLWRDFSSADIDIDGDMTRHRAKFLLKDDGFALTGELSGGYEQGVYTGALNYGHASTNGTSLKLVNSAKFEYSKSNLRISAHCWEGGTGGLCVNAPLVWQKNQGSANISLQNFDLQTLSVWRTLPIAGRLSGHARIDFAPNSTYIDTDMALTGGAIVKDGTRINIHNARLVAKSEGERIMLQAQSDMLGGQARFDGNLQGRALTGRLVGQNIMLAPLLVHLPMLSALEGRADMDLAVGGTVRVPTLQGVAKVNNLGVAFAELPLRLHDGNGLVQIDDKGADFGMDFSMGRGKGTVVGRAERDGRINLTLTGDALKFARPPTLNADISPHIQVEILPKQKKARVSGYALVQGGQLAPPNARDGAVTSSPYAVVIDRRVRADTAKILQSVAPWQIDADVALDIGNEMSFKGFGARLPLTGALHLTQKGTGKLRAFGVVQVARADTVHALGQRLTLNYANVRFEGAPRLPTIHIEASRQIEGETVGVRINGVAKNLNIEVFATGGLSQAQARSALITGSASGRVSESEFTGQINNTLAAAGLSFGLQGTQDFTNDLGRAFGLQSLIVDAQGTNVDTNVNITGYLSPELYVRYGVGIFNAQNSLSVRYQLTKSVYIEATNAAQNVVDVVYSRKF